MSIRVHELARGVGVTSRDLIAELVSMDEYVKSAVSVVADPVARRIRQLHPVAPRPDAETKPAFADSGVQPTNTERAAMRPSAVRGMNCRPGFRRPRREWYRGDPPGVLLTIILRNVQMPRRRPNDRCPVGRYYQDEVDEARRAQAEWSKYLFDLPLTEIEEWLQEAPDIDARTASALSTRGVKPTDLQLRLWSGVIHRTGATLADRIGWASVDPVTVAAELAEWRANGSPREASGF